MDKGENFWTVERIVEWHKKNERIEQLEEDAFYEDKEGRGVRYKDWCQQLLSENATLKELLAKEQESVTFLDASFDIKQRLVVAENENAKLLQAVNDKDQELFESQELVGELLEALEEAMIVVALYNHSYPNTIQGIDASDKGYLAIRKAKESE